jgi:hypothetical protein
MDEREKMFLKARYSTADLRGHGAELYARKKELQTGAPGARAGRKEEGGVMKALVYNGPRDVSGAGHARRPHRAPHRCAGAHHPHQHLRLGPPHVRRPHRHEAGPHPRPRERGRGDRGRPAVDRVKVGDMVSLPFNIGCGFCENCERGLSNYCLTCNPGLAGAAYGFADMGPYHGGQAELLRVPYADYNCLILPRDAKEKQNDYVMLSDIFPTGYHATEMAQLRPGQSVRDLRRRAGRADGGPVGHGQGRQPGDGGRHPQGPAGAGREDRRGPDRRHRGRRHSSGDGAHRRARRGLRLRMRGLPVLQHAPGGSAQPHHEQPGECGQVHRPHRLRGRVRAAWTRTARTSCSAREDGVRLRHVLVQGPEAGHGPVPGEGLQPLPQPPDPCWR